MKRIRFAAFVAAIAATASVANAGGAGEPPDGLIVDAIQAPATVSYVGQVEAVRAGAEQSEVFQYRVEHRAPDLSVRIYTAPKALAGDEIVMRGSTRYDVDKQRQRVVVSANLAEHDELALDDNYLLMRENYRATKRNDASFDGRDVYVVAMVNKYSNKSLMVVTIDKQTKLVLDKQRFASDGSLASETRLQDIHFVSSVPDADFAVPAGLQRVQGPQFGAASENVAQIVAQAGFAAHGPKFLPLGFKPVEGKIVSIKGVRTVHLLYSDGIRTVSLFEDVSDGTLTMAHLQPESTTVGGHNAQYAESGHTTLLAWSQDGLHCKLVGELDLGELQQIAASI